ncbi:MAG: GTP pyrophosphokinase family protein, partial [Rhodococcus fascians]
KYSGTIPAPLLDELTEAADSANRLDVTMERLHDEVAEFKNDKSDDAIHLNSMPPLALPRELLIAMLDGTRSL